MENIPAEETNIQKFNYKTNKQTNKTDRQKKTQKKTISKFNISDGEVE